ncbi:hypothetical protein B0J11DRAFT_586194 [Dendryphion nanum]|uniref:Rhodopsin domain-containing protein n=1 Tax=Dendryphion nanum TaxID=256645 RepID=A0A9P9I8Q2_9PLEO|nr:hypothetical protein B0J11DRAFT_586194 [Dendryphion nanum]
MKLHTLFKLLYYVNIHQIMYGPTIFSIKAAIILQYISIFAPGRTFNKFMFYGGWTTIAANFLFYFIRTIISCVYCIPREKIWNKLLLGGTCIRQDWFIVSSGFVNAVSDIVILLLPVASVWAMQIPRKKKIQICLLFATGLLACLASCIRIYYGWKTTIGTQGQIDASYYLAYEGLWTYAEMALGIIDQVLLSQALGRSNSQIELVDSDIYQLDDEQKRGTAGSSRQVTTIFRDNDAESQRNLGRDIYVAVDINQSTKNVVKA